MTDNEIIKALECCIGDTDGKDCFGCPLYEIDDCQAHLNLAALDLINRQKSEIERLKKGWKADVILTANVKAEAYKEFADRLKENSIATFSWNGVVLVEEIDNLVKEMVGDNNA